MITVIGAGAMGAALAVHIARAGRPASLAGTRFDDATVELLRSGRPHPALGVSLPATVIAHNHEEWSEVIPEADVLIVAVSSGGLGYVVSDVASRSRPDAVWVVATKGWDEETLRSPSEVVAAAVGSEVRPAILGGPVLAPELVAGAPTGMVCASSDTETAQRVAALVRSDVVAVTITDDVVGVEAAAAYKNVTAIGVGMAEGLGERSPESVYVHRFGNARAAVFAAGLQDMTRLASARGGRPETILGPAGAGDLYVTCLGGRNGNFGRLLGAGQTPEQAQETIGSTVEGVANTRVALAIGDRHGVDLRVARAVDSVLSGRTPPEAAVKELLESPGVST